MVINREMTCWPLMSLRTKLDSKWHALALTISFRWFRGCALYSVSFKSFLKKDVKICTFFIPSSGKHVTSLYITLCNWDRSHRRCFSVYHFYGILERLRGFLWPKIALLFWPTENWNCKSWENARSGHTECFIFYSIWFINESTIFKIFETRQQ